MRRKLEARDEEVLDFQENFTSLRHEVDVKTRKLRKLYAKWQQVCVVLFLLSCIDRIFCLFLCWFDFTRFP